MVTRFIDFIKSTAFVLGYLFAVATAYYLSFWSYFDIDVFQFISVEDIIKGIAYPLRFADIGIISIFAFFVIIFAVVGFSKIEDKTVRLVLIGFLAILIAIALWVLYYFKYSNASPIAGLASTALLTIILIVICVIIDGAHQEDKIKAEKAKEEFNDVHPLIDFRNSIVLFALIFFPINAIIAGQVNARDIHDGKNYNYIMRQDLPKDNVSIRYDYLVFLGAVSEKYIFINKNENERFVIDKDELKSLRINHYNVNDKASVNHLADNLRAQSTATN